MPQIPLLDKVREMILERELKPGERITEIGLAERLGLSRTPVRNVLPALAAEGLLQPVGRRGLAVAAFSEQESLDALELRGVLEGHAARLLALRGASDETMAALEACLAEGDGLFRKRFFEQQDKAVYGAMNERFHQLIVETAGSPTLATLLDRVKRVPFVDPGLIIFDSVDIEGIYDLLFRAHGHHHAIVDAIRHRDGARADVLFREHSNAQRLSMFEKHMT